MAVGAVLAVGCGHPTTTVSPVAAPTFTRATGFDEVRAYLAREVEAGTFPGGVLVVGHRGRVVLSHAFGRYGEDDPRPVSDSTIYDLASLTKVVGLTTAVMLLVAGGRIDLAAPVARYLPEFTGGAKDRVVVRHLLLHDAGLPAWRPLFEQADGPAEARALAIGTPLDTLPGTVFVYSDLGAIVLTAAVERVAGSAIDAFLTGHVFAPLGMRATRFAPPDDWQLRIAPTERDPWRGRLLRGEVHDENAARLGGVSGHAGLFSTGPDLARFTFWLLDAYHGRGPRSGPALAWPLVRHFTSRYGEPAGSSRALGWDTPSGRSSGGTCLGPNSFGHTGFTGTSLWIDPDVELVIILLTNRVHPTRENDAIRRVRPAVADLVVKAVAGHGTCVDTLPGAS